MELKEQPLQAARQEVPVINADPTQGLTHEQVAQRLQCGWSNRAADGVMRSDREILLQHIVTFFNLVFVVLAVCLAFVGSFKNMTFMVVVIINTVIGIVQEIRAKRAVEKLTLVAARPMRAVRQGSLYEVPSQELVRDDIVIFGPGDQICADGVLRAGQLQVNEALVTGEADLIEKKPGDELKSGSFVAAGRGRAQLTRVGSDAFAAKLSMEAKADPRAAKSEMMRSLDKLIRVVGVALVPVGIVLFWQEFRVLGLELKDSVEATVAALVGMIPEGLYLLTSVAMAASALKLTRRKVLVQDMNCIETLARVDVLCVDKTGTITEPGMDVENVIPLTGHPPEHLEAVLSALYGGQEPDNETAKALAEMFTQTPGWRELRRVPFNAAFKWSGAEFEGQGAFVVGAPEFVMGARYSELSPKVTPWLELGNRVLLCAAYSGPLAAGTLDAARLTPMALILLAGRIRPQAVETFAYFARQGVAVKVISGDNPATVSQVALRAGIPGAGNYVDARELVTEADIYDAAERYQVFGRVTPDQKKALIRAMKQQGHTVAMTGDGVNDVLAMRESSCGLAMAQGAQAASQVAQLVLLESDFGVMPQIVGEGRRVINNIQRAATLFLVKNIFSLSLALISLLTGWPYPIVPLHLSMVSALTIGVPAFFLAMEPNYERISGHFLRGVLRKAFPGGLTALLVVLMAQLFMDVFALELEQTAIICAAVLSAVGMLVLQRVCTPFDRWRRLVWWAMAAALVGCFTLLGGILELHTAEPTTLLVMATLLIMTPTVFFALQKLFDWGDILVARLRAWRHRHADL